MPGFFMLILIFTMVMGSKKHSIWLTVWWHARFINSKNTSLEQGISMILVMMPESTTVLIFRLMKDWMILHFSIFIKWSSRESCNNSSLKLYYCKEEVIVWVGTDWGVSTWVWKDMEALSNIWKNSMFPFWWLEVEGTP